MYNADSFNLLCIEFGLKKKHRLILVMITMTNNDKVNNVLTFVLIDDYRACNSPPPPALFFVK